MFSKASIGCDVLSKIQKYEDQTSKSLLNKNNTRKLGTVGISFHTNKCTPRRAFFMQSSTCYSKLEHLMQASFQIVYFRQTIICLLPQTYSPPVKPPGPLLVTNCAAEIYNFLKLLSIHIKISNRFCSVPPEPIVLPLRSKLSLVCSLKPEFSECCVSV